MEPAHELCSLGRPLAVGRTAEIFRWEDGRVLKLFRREWNEGAACIEAQKARAVYAAGLPAPAVYERVQIADRFGIVYEEIRGRSLVEVLRIRPWRIGSAARILADLQLQLHQVRLATLPPLRERLAQAIQRAPGLSHGDRHALLITLARLPEGNSVCHGDFHPLNVFLTERGPVVLDWIDATQGTPWADVARTSLLIRGAALPADTPRPRVVQLMRRLLHRTYLRLYFAGRPPDPDEWQAWQAVVAGARLAEQVPGEQAGLLSMARAGLGR